MSGVIEDGLTFSGYVQPGSVPADPVDQDWRGEPGPPGPAGAAGSTGAAGVAGPTGATGAAGAGAVPAVASVSGLWAGAVTASGFRVNFDVIGAAPALVGLRVSASADMSSPVYAPVDAAPTITAGYGVTYYTGAFTVTGLAANTTYYYQARVNGAASGSAQTVRTFASITAAASFKYAFGSCSVSSGYTGAPNVWGAIAADQPHLFVHLGDIDYSDINVGDLTYVRTRNVRTFRVQRWVSQALASVPFAYMYDDHDAGVDNNDNYSSVYVDGTSNFQALANTRQAAREVTPFYPFVQDTLGGFPADRVLLTQVWDHGRVRFIMPDIRGQRWTGDEAVAATLLGHAGDNPVAYWDQFSWLLGALDQAVTDGKKLIVLLWSSEWWPSANDGWWLAPLERTAICDKIRGLDVAVMLWCGDAHALYADDGTNVDFSTLGDVKFPAFVSSAVNQPGAAGKGTAIYDSIAGFCRWNGAQATPNGEHGNANGYMLASFVDSGGNNLTWTVTAKGNPISGATPTTLATYSSGDAAVSVGFQGGATINVVNGSDATLTVKKTWFGPIGGCSAAWSCSDGSSGTVVFKPNCNTASIPRTFTTNATVTYTLSSPVGCTIGAASTQTIVYFTPQTETATYLAAMTTQPSTVQIFAIDTLIAGLKTDGLWALTLKAWWLSAHDNQASRLNMPAPASSTLVANGQVVFSALKGWWNPDKVSTVVGYLETGYAIQAGNQNSLAMFAWVPGETFGNGDMGGDNYLINAVNDAIGGAKFRSASATTDTVTGVAPGFVGFSRTASTGYSYYSNGAKVGTVTRTSSAVTATTMWLSGWNNAAPQYSPKKQAFSIITSGLNDTQVTNLYNRVHTFLQTVGVVA